MQLTCNRCGISDLMQTAQTLRHSGTKSGLFLPLRALPLKNVGVQNELHPVHVQVPGRVTDKRVSVVRLRTACETVQKAAYQKGGLRSSTYTYTYTNESGANFCIEPLN